MASETVSGSRMKSWKLGESVRSWMKGVRTHIGWMILGMGCSVEFDSEGRTAKVRRVRGGIGKGGNWECYGIREREGVTHVVRTLGAE